MALKRIACLGTATWTPYSLSLCWCVRLSCSDSTSLPLFHILDSRTHGSETVNWHHLPIFPKLPHYSKGLLMGLWTQPLVQTSWGYSHRLSHASVAFLLGQLKCSSVSETCRCSVTLIATFFVFFLLLLFCFLFFFFSSPPKHNEHVLQIAFCRLSVPLASVSASEESWGELGAEQVPAVRKPYHDAPTLFEHWSDGCYSTPHTAEYKRGVINM